MHDVCRARGCQFPFKQKCKKQQRMFTGMWAPEDGSRIHGQTLTDNICVVLGTFFLTWFLLLRSGHTVHSYFRGWWDDPRRQCMWSSDWWSLATYTHNHCMRIFYVRSMCKCHELLLPFSVYILQIVLFPVVWLMFPSKPSETRNPRWHLGSIASGDPGFGRQWKAWWLCPTFQPPPPAL